MSDTDSGEHYFTADPSVAFEREPVRLTVWGQEMSLVSGSGVFARGRLDIGTSVLFRETTPPAGGRILDLGCGYGVIGLAVARTVPDAVVTAVGSTSAGVSAAYRSATPSVAAFSLASRTARSLTSTAVTTASGTVRATASPMTP